ncbi:MAG: MaoC family dehydratase [Rhodospirillaceae bacterium]|nr:MaoC family dehydratase [Rhodospirillaceae bacterium]
MAGVWYDDYDVGHVFEFGEVTVVKEEIIGFARKYDPQPFHVDEEAAAAGVYGGIIASGWHTVCVCMRLIVDNMMGSESGSIGSPGLSEVSWPKPVRPGDTLRLRGEILEKIPSKSKPDRGFWRVRFAALNQDDEEVAVMVPLQYFLKRPDAPAGSSAGN